MDGISGATAKEGHGGWLEEPFLGRGQHLGADDKEVAVRRECLKSRYSCWL